MLSYAMLLSAAHAITIFADAAILRLIPRFMPTAACHVSISLLID